MQWRTLLGHWRRMNLNWHAHSSSNSQTLFENDRTTTPLYTQCALHAYKHKYRLESTQMQLMFCEGSEYLGWGNDVCFWGGIRFSAWMTEAPHCCHAVRSNLSSFPICFFIFFWLTLYLRSVCLFCCFLCTCKIWVREVKADVPLEQRFSYHVRDWINVSTGMTLLFWWHWYYFQ